MRLTTISKKTVSGIGVMDSIIAGFGAIKDTAIAIAVTIIAIVTAIVIKSCCYYCYRFVVIDY